MKMNVGYLLVNTADRYPTKLALAADGREYTYQDYNQRVNRLANFLRASGVRPGDRVATLMHNSPGQVESYLACAKIGAIFTPLNYRLNGSELEYLIKHSEAKYLIYAREFCREADYLTHVCCLDLVIQIGGELLPTALDYEMIMQSSDDLEPDPTPSEDDPCQLLYTSGTTGRPKGVILTHRNVLWNSMNCLLSRGDRTEDVFLLVGPLYHVAGLNSHFTPKVAVGATVVIMKSFESREMMRLIAERQVTMVSAAPSLFHLLFELPGLKGYDTSSVTSCSVGASICPQETKKKMMELFPRAKGVIDVYGQTEATCNLSILRPEDWERKPDSVGAGLPFTQVRLVDQHDQEVPVNQVGEITCRGPNIMDGYYKNEEGTREVLRDGWLHTGDLGRRDEEGYLYIVGRIKDIIISGGENIYPGEVEEVLYTHPKISEAAVIGVADHKWGEAVKALVVLKPGQSAAGEEIIQFCKQKIASYKSPKSVDFLLEMPKTSSGKIDKKALKKV